MNSPELRNALLEYANTDIGTGLDNEAIETGHDLAMAVRHYWHPDEAPPAIAAAYENFMALYHRRKEVK